MFTSHTANMNYTKALQGDKIKGEAIQFQK